MPKTIDLLFDRKNVNAIFIFQAYPVQLIKQYDCENGNWNDNVKPSEIIKKNERDKSITNRLPNDY